jgi:hypothetical protein
LKKLKTILDTPASALDADDLAKLQGAVTGYFASGKTFEERDEASRADSERKAVEKTKSASGKIGAPVKEPVNE